MFTLTTWTLIQDQLLADPGYAGMKPGRSVGSVVVVWRPNTQPGPAGEAAVHMLHSLGVEVDHETGSAPPLDVIPEMDRLIGPRSSWLRVYVVGANSSEDRVNVTVATGSFAEAIARDTDVLTELGPLLPVSIVESDRPVATNQTIP